jgi:hypothetical protein
MVIVGRASSQELVPTAALLFHAHAFLAPSRSSSANETGGVRPPRTSFRREIPGRGGARAAAAANRHRTRSCSPGRCGGGRCRPTRWQRSQCAPATTSSAAASVFEDFDRFYRNFRPIFEKKSPNSEEFQPTFNRFYRFSVKPVL